MEHIRQAVELAKARNATAPSPPASPEARALLHNSSSATAPANRIESSRPEHDRKDADRKDGERNDANSVALDPERLESMRVIAHNVLDPRSRAYDMLRTQVLRTMAAENWQLIGVTSPTVGCGKTLTAVNLAMSISRQPEKSALLIDLDMQRPQVAKTLGLNTDKGLFAVLEGEIAVQDALLQARIGNHHVSLLPCETSTSHSSEWMSSREMSSLLQSIRTNYRSQTAIIDLPPILAGDEVISVLPQLDCVILVASVGVSTTSNIERCKKHLQSTEVVRVVLNRASEQGFEHYYY
jgi:protein-tyrosine kinase